jgi:hypothetical protein
MGNWQFLAEMQEHDVKNGGWRFTHDGFVDDQPHTPITVNGYPSHKGLGMHPLPSDFAAVKYRLDRKFGKFRSGVAINDTGNEVIGPLVFEVWADGKRIWQSERITRFREFRELAIDVADVDVLELRAVSPGSAHCHHSVWLEPRVLKK